MEMAYVAWRIFVDKYYQVRYGVNSNWRETAVTPANGDGSAALNPENWCNPPDECNRKEYDLESGHENHQPTATDVKRSKSKVRIYLKRCKKVLIGTQHQYSGQSTNDVICPNAPHDVSNSANDVVTDLDESTIQVEGCYELCTINEQKINNQLMENNLPLNDKESTDQFMPASVADVQCNENQLVNDSPECLDGDTSSKEIDSTDNMTDIISMKNLFDGTIEMNTNCGVANLVDRYLESIYPDYIDHTRSILIRQARDMLICRYHGDLQRFETDFMIPAAEIIDQVKLSCIKGSNWLWPIGWPLSVAGALVLHLGTIEESLIRPSDIYLCVRPIILNEVQVKVELCAVWRTNNFIINYHPLNPVKDSFGPIGIEMLAEELPQLLQSLLVGVEHAINRISLDELNFPHESKYTAGETTTERKLSDPAHILSAQNSPKCALKRRELITKNKYLNNKYVMKRMSQKKQLLQVNSIDECKTIVGGECNVIDLNGLNTIEMDNSGTSCSVADGKNTMPLFCLGGSFPHIDSDEETVDDLQHRTNREARLPHDIVAPRSIQDIPEKLLMSGIYLPGKEILQRKTTLITIEAQKLINSCINCYEIATVLLYYSTIPISRSPITLHIVIENSEQKICVLELLDSSIQLLCGYITIDEIFLTILKEQYSNGDTPYQPEPMELSQIKITYAQDVSNLLATNDIPLICGGCHQHNQERWYEFFTALEPFRDQCLDAGKKLVNVLAEIRSSDLQGNLTRRQLHAQHRALSRALMESELQVLRRKGIQTINRLNELAMCINSTTKRPHNVIDNKTNIIDNWNCGNTTKDMELIINQQDHVTNRLSEVITIFNEVDRAARRLEQLTDQRRDRLREMTRQRALEDEVNEVFVWLRTNGEDSIKKFINVQLENEEILREQEHEFEKFYFISKKHLSKGRDLYDASLELESLKTISDRLKDQLKEFGDRLEEIREKIEGASRLHHLLSLQLKEDDVQLEMQRLAEKINVPGLIERCKEGQSKHSNTTVEKPIAASTPLKCKSEIPDECNTTETNELNGSVVNQLNEESKPKNTDEDDEEDHSKIADSGLGGCDRCEGNDKLIRTCSCQSFEDTNNVCNKSHNSDDLDEDCFESNTKQQTDIQIHLHPNAHLLYHETNMELPEFEEANGLDPKTQRTLLLIMREMIGTERDYVRSLQYIIENYIQELLRDDIPQSLRGQRNVIFGNVEKIYEFHQLYFLDELEKCESNPLKVGAAFVKYDEKFYLYALYNKNKPKSDSLMSEYGASFFKSKQMELNDKMDLASYLLKPVQRMGKYALLLQQLIKALLPYQTSSNNNELLEDIEELQKAEIMVRFQLRHGNDLLAMDSLRDCDVNVKEQGRLLRQNEFLVWQGRGGKKCIRQVFLFEELVLFSKARRFPDRKNLDLYIYKNSIKTSDIGLTAHVGDSKTKFEIWFRKRKPEDTWTLQSFSEDIKNLWSNEISRLLWEQAKKNRAIRMQEMSSMGIGNKPCLDIRPSQNQINDRSISVTQLAPKLRTFHDELPTGVKHSLRPHSLISDVSSLSSGTSNSSIHTSITNSSGDSGTKSRRESGLEKITETSGVSAKSIGSASRKHQRSTTLISQVSMESGIIADICLSPDADKQQETLNWAMCSKKTPTIKRINEMEKSKTIVIDNIQSNSEDPYLNESVHL